MFHDDHIIKGIKHEKNQIIYADIVHYAEECQLKYVPYEGYCVEVTELVHLFSAQHMKLLVLKKFVKLKFKNYCLMT